MRMTESGSIINLPGGLWHKGRRCQQLEIHPLTGRDQEYLKSTSNITSQAQWSTLVMTRCVHRIGPITTITPDLIRSLTIGDREFVLLHIRAQTFGEKLSCVVNCSQSDCQGQIGIDVDIGDLLLPPYSEFQQSYQRTIKNNEDNYKVDFRLPRGMDQEKIAVVAKNDPESAAIQLICSCILKVMKNGRVYTKTIPHLVNAELFNTMDELDPQAEISFGITCPECSAEFSFLLDMGMFFRDELKQRYNDLFSEVHFLAYHYHWSEQEIMTMTVGKRRLYCDLLLNEISEKVM